MKQKMMQFITMLLALLFCMPTMAGAAKVEINPTIRVGLRYGSSTINSANLLNETGSGYRLGYYDGDLEFVPLGYTDHTRLSVLKTTNLYYGTDSEGWGGYYSTATSGRSVGCYHVQMPGSYASFEEAKAAAAQYEDGFPAWINGTYQVRVGAYLERSGAERTQASLGGTIVGTSSYGVTVVDTLTAELLFQFDGGSSYALGVEPGLDGQEEANTWFRGYTYYGGFRFERIGGGDLTVVNVVPLEDYVRGVAPYEMSNTWPLEALKAQTVCARTYAVIQAERSRHSSSHFDICNTTHCQVYRGNNSANERTDQAVDETWGVYAYYKGELAETYYYSCNGGASEDVRNVWNENSNMPYLVGVMDPFEPTVADKTGKYNWTVTYTKAELTQKLRSYGFQDCADIVNFYVSQLTPTGNVRSVTFVDSNNKSWTVSKGEVRSLLGLDSIRFTISGGGKFYVDGSESTLDSVTGAYAIGGDGTVSQIDGTGGTYIITGSGTSALSASADQYTITGSGWGHNVGMSQWGAYAMAQMGYSYDEILKFYFTGIEVY